MAFSSTGLILLFEGGFGTCPRLWSYISTDTSVTVAGTGYFAGQGQGSPFGSTRGIAGMALNDHVIVQESTNGATPGRSVILGVKGSSANGSTVGSTWGYDITLASSAA